MFVYGIVPVNTFTCHSPGYKALGLAVSCQGVRGSPKV